MSNNLLLTELDLTETIIIDRTRSPQLHALKRPKRTLLINNTNISNINKTNDDDDDDIDSNRFLVSKDIAKQILGLQYSTIYYQRLMKLKRLLISSKNKFGSICPLMSIINLGVAAEKEEEDINTNKEKDSQNTQTQNKKESMDADDDNKNASSSSSLGPECVIIGTIYKEMSKKPIILDEYIKTKAGVTKKEQVDNGLIDTEENFVDLEQDYCILEDESARVKLKGPGVNTGVLVTGVIAAAKGRVNAKGDFVVDAMVFAQTKSESDDDNKMDTGVIGLEKNTAATESSYVCLVSGLNFGASASNDARAALLSEFIEGSLLLSSSSNDNNNNNNSYEEEQKKLIAAISHVVVCGELVSSKTREEERILGEKPKNGEAPKVKPTTNSSMQKADAFLAKLCELVTVDVMPGTSDPTNSALPQQPIHSCFFPNAARFEGSTFNKVTNPHEFQISSSSSAEASTSLSSSSSEQIMFLGTSGQNVRDCLQNSSTGIGLKEKSAEEKSKAVLDVMERFLCWGHIAPSAPDTLACYPFKDRDPFVLTHVPDVFYAGCQSAFGAREVVVASKKSVLISVPSFSETGSVVLLNLKTMKAEEVTFTIAQ